MVGESMGWRQEGPPQEVRRSEGSGGEHRVGTRDPLGSGVRRGRGLSPRQGLLPRSVTGTHLAAPQGRPTVKGPGSL